MKDIIEKQRNFFEKQIFLRQNSKQLPILSIFSPYSLFVAMFVMSFPTIIPDFVISFVCESLPGFFVQPTHLIHDLSG